MNKESKGAKNTGRTVEDVLGCCAVMPREELSAAVDDIGRGRFQLASGDLRKGLRVGLRTQLLSRFGLAWVLLI